MYSQTKRSLASGNKMCGCHCDSLWENIKFMSKNCFVNRSKSVLKTQHKSHAGKIIKTLYGVLETAQTNQCCKQYITVKKR